MSFKFSVGLIAVLVVALALPGAAMATKSRVESMNIQSDYVIDNVNVMNYPSALFRHQNAIYVELGKREPDSSGLIDDSGFENNTETSVTDGTNRSVGGHFGNFWEGRIGVFGIYLNEQADPFTSMTGAEYINRTPNESINILWANQFGGTTLGLEFNRTFSEMKDERGEMTSMQPYTGPDPLISIGSNSRQMFNAYMTGVGGDHWNTIGFGAGLSFDWENDQGYDSFVDLSGEVRSFSFENTDTTNAATFESDGGPSFAFNGRAFLQTAENLWWVPVFNFATYNFDWKSSNNTGDPASNFTASNSVTMFNIGIAGDWQVRESDLIVAGVAFQSTSADFDDWDPPRSSGAVAFKDTTMKFSYIRVPLFISLEANVTRWLTFRAGALKPIYAKFEDEDAAGEKESKTDSPFEFNMGAGVHVGNFHFDALMNQDWTFTGGPLAGDVETIPFLRLSTTYKF